MHKVIEYTPSNVCSRKLKIVVNDGIVTSMEVLGGCNGNIQGIIHLIEGMKVDDVITRLENIKCRGSRDGNTSCPDQIAKALKTITQ